MSKRLAKTFITFDGVSGDGQDSTVASSTVVRHWRASHVRSSLLIESLVEQLCCFYETDPQKQSSLCHYICNNLSRLKFFIPENYPDTIRLKFRQIFNNFITVSVGKCGSSSSNSLVLRDNFIIPENQSTFSNLLNEKIFFHNSRYKYDFEESEIIASGAFGVVCKAWRKVDQMFYAVKKIPYKFQQDPLLKRVLREVECLAQINHPNIVGYKSAWIESPDELDPYLETFESSSETDTSDEQRESSFYKTNTEDTDSIIFESIGKGSSSHYTVKNEENYKVHKYSLQPDQNDYDNSVIFEPHYHKSAKFCSCNTTTIVCDTNNFNTQHFNVCNSINYQRFYSTGETELRDSHNIGTKEQCKSSSSDPTQKAVVRHAYRRSSSNSDMLVRVKDISTNNNKATQCKAILYVQMELCEESLRQWLDNRLAIKQPVDYIASKMILKQVLKGLEYLHSKSLIHRDLKPQNILFNETSVKLGDFGLATLCCSQSEEGAGDMDSNHSGLTRGVGTSPYAAPEQRTNNLYGPKADMYSIGVILLELLHPFTTTMELSTYFERSGQLSHLPEAIKKEQPEAAEMIVRLTQSNPNNRPSATDVLRSEMFLSKSQIIEILTERNQFLEKQLAEKEKGLLVKDDEIAVLKLKLQMLNL